MKLAAGIENEAMLEEVKSSPGYNKIESGILSMTCMLVAQRDIYQGGLTGSCETCAGRLGEVLLR